nr:MAG TPA: hypothetical protein [Bacteriophage sp.]
MYGCFALKASRVRTGMSLLLEPTPVVLLI